MKSIKPGRGPSAMNAFGSVIGIVFGIIWTGLAASMGAPFFFPLFGILFIIVGIVQAVYHFKNATGENRYSAFDITEDGEEVDPLNARFGGSAPRDSGSFDGAGDFRFCPYCGAELGDGFEFCGKCGRKLPED